MNFLFASTARGLEELLKTELESLGATDCKVAQGGVHFQADERVMYKSLLWSRLASRILLPLNEFKVYSDLDLYLGVQAIDWTEIFDVRDTFVIHFGGTNEVIRNSQYGALRVKDAIVDCFQRKLEQRPDVAKQRPDIRVNVYLNRDQVSVALDLSGDSLHIRGYRDLAGQAPLKETLGAVIVNRSGWLPDTPLIDPMCGSGTLLIEAAMIATDRAPGLHREHWGFQAWSKFNPELWRELVAEAQVRFRQGLQNNKAHFYGFDIDRRVLDMARSNIRRAELQNIITLQQGDAANLENPVEPGIVGTIVSNPPYGERLESEPALVALYSQLGRVAKARFPGWRLSLFSASPELLSCLQLRSEREFKARNGPLDCVQKNYLLAEKPTESIGEIAADYGNRLRKNIKKLSKWAKQEGVDCYRIYDADLPDYNVAVDRYGDKIVVQEYAPPKTVDERKARQRLFDVITTTMSVLGLTSNQLVLKTRQRQKGKQQYEKLAQKDDSFLVNEYNAQFWVNLTDYLDTGLFLDHRIARKMLGEMSKGKDFLNLFAYTGTASVHAGLGGARTTTSVDMSRTYLEWAEKNLQVNGLNGRQHRLIQADCLTWLAQTDEQFDLIFIDPPTFSNSKRMDGTFDVQRDHIHLMENLKKLLRPGGTLMFSNNKRGFKMDLPALAELGLQGEEITAQTLSEDFARNRHIHNCWLIRHVA